MAAIGKAVHAAGIALPGWLNGSQSTPARGMARDLEYAVQPIYIHIPVRKSKHSTEMILEPVAITPPVALTDLLYRANPSFIYGTLDAAGQHKFWDQCEP